MRGKGRGREGGDSHVLVEDGGAGHLLHRHGDLPTCIESVGRKAGISTEQVAFAPQKWGDGPVDTLQPRYGSKCDRWGCARGAGIEYRRATRRGQGGDGQRAVGSDCGE